MQLQKPQLAVRILIESGVTKLDELAQRVDQGWDHIFEMRDAGMIVLDGDCARVAADRKD